MLTLPNILTLSRIIMVPMLVFFLWDPHSHWGYLVAFALYALMGITDYFDGYLARTQGAVSKLGTFLDPIADKIMVASVILMLVAVRVIDGWAIIPALIILLREIAVSGLREFLAGLQVSLPVSVLAKWKTTLQIVSLGLLILGTWYYYQADIDNQLRQTPIMVGLTTLWIAAGLTLVTGWDYLRVGLKHMD